VTVSKGRQSLPERQEGGAQLPLIDRCDLWHISLDFSLPASIRGGQEVVSTGQRKRLKHQRRKAFRELLARLEPALQQLNGLIALHRHLAAAEDAVEPAVFGVLVGSLELAQRELSESYSQLWKLAAGQELGSLPE
jgi:hypothetical protein